MLTRTMFQAYLDTRQPIRHLRVQQRKNNVPKTFFWHYYVDLEQANAYIDKTPTRRQWHGKLNETSDNPSVIYPLKGTTTF